MTPWTTESVEFSRPEYWSGSFPSLEDLRKPGIKPRSPTLQVNSLPAEPPGKPKKTWVGSLCLLQQIFPTQELNWGLLHCRQIPYQLSHKGSPFPSGKGFICKGIRQRDERSSAHFKIVLFVFFILSCLTVYIFWILMVYWLFCLHIFSSIQHVIFFFRQWFSFVCLFLL